MNENYNIDLMKMGCLKTFCCGETFVGKKSFAGAEGDSEASSNHPRLGCETTSNDYSKMLTISCKYSVSGLCKEIPNGRRHLAVSV